MSRHYSLLFYLKKPKKYISGPKPIYMRITLDGLPREISTGKNCDPSRWNSKANRVNGTNEEIKTINAYLDALANKLANIHLQCIKESAEITSEMLKQRFLGGHTERHYLIEEFSEHNKKMESLIGNGFKPNTLKGYKTTKTHLTMFLAKKLNLEDIDITKINLAFIEEFEFYLRSERKNSSITAAKPIKHLRKIINLSLAHQWISENPFIFYKTRAKPKEVEFLTKDELDQIEKIEIKDETTDSVRDIFIFCCYTGLSYIDVKQLRTSDISEGTDGKLWILISRIKTETNSNIPLLPKALNIINKYADYPPSIAKGLALPVLSNQKMNIYLKKIIDLCKIYKKISFHKARHTFATTVTLSNNVPIETVSKMLGHSSIKATQHYAKLLDIKVASDMQALEEKLALNIELPKK
jgi:site-specific recombinase XerD